MAERTLASIDDLRSTSTKRKRPYHGTFTDAFSGENSDANREDCVSDEGDFENDCPSCKLRRRLYGECRVDVLSDFNAQPTRIQTSKSTRIANRHQQGCSRLTISNLKAIINALWEARIKWDRIGLQLNIRIDNLEEVRVAHGNDPSKCFEQMLIIWLKRDESPPTVSAMVEALQAECVGFGQLASQFARFHIREIQRSIVKNTAEEPVFTCPCGQCSLESYLKDRCPRSHQSFPYLDVDNLKKKQKERLILILSDDIKLVKKEFAEMLEKVCESLQLKEVKPKKLANRVLFFTPELLSEHHQKKLVKSKYIDDSFRILRKYMSFFNYELLKHIIDWPLCPKENHEHLKKYREILSKFCRKRVFQVPCNAYSDVKESDTEQKEFVVLITEDEMKSNLIYDTDVATIMEAKKEIAGLLKLDPIQLQLHTIDRGCLILVFSIPNYIALRLFPLDHIQTSALRDKGYAVITDIPDGLQSQWNKATWIMLDAALEIVKNSSQSVSLYVVEEIELTTAKGAVSAMTVTKEMKLKADLKKQNGNTLFKEGKYELAVEMYTEAMKLDPSNAILPSNRAIALLKLERYTEAEEDCTTALTLDNTFIKAYFRRATARERLGKLKDAMIDYQSILTLDSHNKDAKTQSDKLKEKLVQQATKLKEKGNDQLKQRRYDLAVENYTQAMQLDPQNAVLPANRAQALIKLQKYMEAEEDCTLSLHLNETYVKAYFRRATARENLGKLKDAIKDCRSALENDPENADIKTKLAKIEERILQAKSLKEKGNNQLKHRRYQQAIDFYTKAMQLDPENALYPANRAQALLKLERYIDAEKDCSLSLSRDETYVKAYLRRATARETLEKLDDAILDYESVITLEPKNKEARKKLPKLKGDVQVKRGDYEKAIEIYSEAIEKVSATSDLLVHRAYALMKMFRCEEAEKDCSRAIEQDKECVDAYIRRADARVMCCKLEEAKQDYIIALKLDPTNETIVAEIKKLETDVMTLIDHGACECYNEDKSHPLRQVFSQNDSEYLESCKEEQGQLMIHIPFRCPVKLTSVQIISPTDGRAPKTIKLFVNWIPETLTIERVRKAEATQELILKEKDTKENAKIGLRCCKFHNIHSITILVMDNQGGRETTVINRLKLIGIPIVDVIPRDTPVTRVAGEEGEFCPKPTCPNEYK